MASEALMADVRVHGAQGSSLLAPQLAVSEEEERRGLQLLVRESVYSGAVSALTGGAVLTAVAMHLGASNFTIGLLAAAPFLTQLLQLPTIQLIEVTRGRKRIAVLTSIVGRTMLLGMGISAMLGGAGALFALVLGQFVLCGMSAIGSCAWNSWLRDFIPEARIGRIMADRTVRSASVSLVAGLAAAGVLALTGEGSTARGEAFLGMFAIGCFAGLLSARLVAQIPEPMLPQRNNQVGLGTILREPLRDANFVRLLRFGLSWHFAANFATPFFTVYIVRQLGLSMGLVLVLGAISQVANVATLNTWGGLADKFSNKSVLQFCAPLFIASIAAMVVTSQIGPDPWQIAWLVVLHLLMGATTAGVTLALANIALKLSPKGSATAFVATNAMATALAAGIAPVIGGLLADFFARRRFELIARWNSPDNNWSLPITLSQWDFYFILSALIGLYALHRLSLVSEQGEIDRRAMKDQVLLHARQAVRSVSSVSGLRAGMDLPASLAREIAVRARFLQRYR
ncbi:MAG: MFS transporter [Porphyrobacter sp.]|nr:MFS transporter [Porphyrobacter sp.]